MFICVLLLCAVTLVRGAIVGSFLDDALRCARAASALRAATQGCYAFLSDATTKQTSALNQINYVTTDFLYASLFAVAFTAGISLLGFFHMYFWTVRARARAMTSTQSSLTLRAVRSV